MVTLKDNPMAHEKRCCLCHESIGDQLQAEITNRKLDAYSLKVKRVGTEDDNPTRYAHGECLRKECRGLLP